MTSYHFIFSSKACFTKLLNVFFASIFRSYDGSRILGGVCKIVVEIPEGWGVYFSGKKWKFRGGGGDLKIPEIPSMVGVWIFSGTIQ